MDIPQEKEEASGYRSQTSLVYISQAISTDAGGKYRSKDPKVISSA
jgi:hypothetical protein